jgi:hypothetical protein
MSLHTTRNDLVLPQYAPNAATYPRPFRPYGNPIQNQSTLPLWTGALPPGAPPAPPYGPVSESNYLQVPSVVSWNETQGGYFPLGATRSGCGCGLGAAVTKDYGIGELCLAGAGGLIAGMLLTYLWMESQRK